MTPSPAAVAIALLHGPAVQSVLDPGSGEARKLLHLLLLFVGVCGVIWALVVAVMLIAIWRRRGGDATPSADTPAQSRRKTLVVGSLVAVTAAILVMFTFVSFAATHGVESDPGPPVQIKVTGKQWWWQVEYQSPDPTQLFTTANEIHIPVGGQVRLDLEAQDVIHSFWAPSLMGKQDLIPGRSNSLVISADHPGIFRGQCAEFCGLQHAQMAFLIVAQPPDQFEAWRQAQLQSAAPPSDPLRSRGRQVFLGAPCAACHAIQGETSGPGVGPDLTHVGGRETLAAGALANTAANLSRWLTDPQAVKPGANMPAVPLSTEDRAAVVAYLEGLK
jgi:cytochrome c oxidase subunit 2